MLDTGKIALTYVLTIPVLFTLDMLWLGLIAKNFYNDQLGALLSGRINWAAAAVFYLIYTFGIIYFAVLPGIAKNSLTEVTVRAALLGFVAYATYDLTNLATIRNWPIKLVLVDIAWGAALTAITAATSYLIAHWTQ